MEGMERNVTTNVQEEIKSIKENAYVTTNPFFVGIQEDRSNVLKKKGHSMFYQKKEEDRNVAAKSSKCRFDSDRMKMFGLPERFGKGTHSKDKVAKPEVETTFNLAEFYEDSTKFLSTYSNNVRPWDIRPWRKEFELELDDAKKRDLSKFVCERDDFGDRQISAILEKTRMEYAKLDAEAIEEKRRKLIHDIQILSDKVEKEGIESIIRRKPHVTTKPPHVTTKLSHAEIPESEKVEKQGIDNIIRRKPHVTTKPSHAEIPESESKLYSMLTTKPSHAEIPESENVAKKLHPEDKKEVAELKVERGNWSKIVFLRDDFSEFKAFPLVSDEVGKQLLEQFMKQRREEEEKNADRVKEKKAV